MSEILHTYRKLADLNPTHQFVLTYIEFLWATDEPGKKDVLRNFLLIQIFHKTELKLKFHSDEAFQKYCPSVQCFRKSSLLLKRFQNITFYFTIVRI